MVWLEDCSVGDFVWLASSFFIVEEVIRYIDGGVSEICKFDPFFVSVLAFWVGKNFGDFDHVYIVRAKSQIFLKFSSHYWMKLNEELGKIKVLRLLFWSMRFCISLKRLLLCVLGLL